MNDGRSDDAQAINLLWLIRLRWWALLGQVLTIAGVEWLLRIPLALAPIDRAGRAWLCQQRSVCPVGAPRPADP
jgi:uncharacterized membrane protein YccF (DUF307 family)